jgi:hypothetical protein
MGIFVSNFRYCVFAVQAGNGLDGPTSPMGALIATKEDNHFEKWS